LIRNLSDWLVSFLAAPPFRLLVVPCAVASLGCWVRYFLAKVAGKKVLFRQNEKLSTEQTVAAKEIFTIWPELMIVGIFNMLILASDFASGPGATTDSTRSESLLVVTVCLSSSLLLLWLVSFTAAQSRPSGKKQVLLSVILPHLLGFGVLELSLILVDLPSGG
jgi:hypothetical protein